MTTPSTASEPPASPPPWLVGVLIALAVGVAAAVRFSPFDDEANAIANASASLGHILEAGLGQNRQFHPPLWEVVLHGWLQLVPFERLPLVRALAVALWALTVGAVSWALAPIADRRTRGLAVVLVALWPPHLVLPFCASWYALAAFFGVTFFGGVLRVFLGVESKRGAAIAVGAGIGLGYTVFAWPLILGSIGVGCALIAGRAALRTQARRWLLLGALVLVALLPTLAGMLSRFGPMLSRQAGGGPLLSMGAALALVVGQSAPASRPLLALAALAASIALALGVAAPDRRARATLVIGTLVLLGLAVTSTLNDKRLLLGSAFFPIGLALATERERGRARALLVALGVASVPAWLGWTGLSHAGWIYPRWQDPIAEIAALATSGAAPRALISDQPSVAYAITAREHASASPEWHPPWEPPRADRTVKWRLRAPAALAEQLQTRAARDPARVTTADLIVSSDREGWALATAQAFEAVGWRRLVDRRFGVDPLATWRHAHGGGFRYCFIRLERP